MTELTIKQQVENVVAAHKVWIETDGQLGVRLDLTGANLSHANLTGAMLHGTDLSSADLRGVILTDTLLVVE